MGALLSGSSVTEAAHAAGVDRTTVHRWLRDDPVFQAAYNGARRALQRELALRLEQMAAAAERVSEAIQAGDIRASLAVLRGLGLLAGDRPHIGPENPDEVTADADLFRRERAAIALRGSS